MISHDQAHALVSARLDSPLDPADNRALLGHLATCASCRQFADQTNVLARGLRDLPQLAPSPVVSRAVLERISQGRSPWTRLWEGVKLAPAPLAAIAAVIVLIAVGANILLGGDDDDNRGNVAQLEANTQTAQATDDAAPTVTEESAETAAAATESGDAPTSETTSASDNGDPSPSPTPISLDGGGRRTPASGDDQDSPSTTTENDEPTATVASTDTDGGPETDPAVGTEPTNDPANDVTDETAEPGAGNDADPEDAAAPSSTQAETDVPDAPIATNEPSESDGGPVVAAALGPDVGTPVASSPTPVIVSGSMRPSPTAEAEATSTEETTATATVPPTNTPEATETATLEATETPSPTETATPRPSPTATETPQATNTPDPTETPDPTPTATSEPTNTPAPTVTETPVSISTPRPTETPEPTNTAEPTATETPEPIATEPPPPTATQDDGPSIVPRAGSEIVEDDTGPVVDDTTEEVEPTDDVTSDEDLEPTPEPEIDEVTVADETPSAIGSDGADPDSDEAAGPDVVQDAEPTPENDGASESRIQQIGEDDAEDETDASGQGDTGDTGDQSNAEPTGAADGPDDTGLADDGAEADAADTVFHLATAPEVISAIPGSTTPNGALRFAGGNIILGVDGGDLTVVTADGSSYRIGVGFYPLWSDGGGQVLYTVDNGVSPTVFVYNLGGGSDSVSPPGPEGEAFRDVPAGWSGGTPVFMRTDRDRQRYVELYAAGSDSPFWRRENTQVVSLTPIQVGGGYLIATTEGWIFVDGGGTESGGGPSPFDEVTAGVAGAGGLVAFLADGGVYVASASNPGGAAYIGAGNGFDISPNGDAIAISDGGSLTVYSIGGGVIDAWTPADGSGVGAPYWTGDGIIVPTGGALRIVPGSEIG